MFHEYLARALRIQTGTAHISGAHKHGGVGARGGLSTWAARLDGVVIYC